METTTTLYHGAHTSYTLHIGQCYTDDSGAAESYASQGRDGELVAIEIDMSDLVVTTVEGYDRDEDEAAGDRDISAFAGHDIIRYTDEDLRGQPHDTWRLVSDKALAAIR